MEVLIRSQAPIQIKLQHLTVECAIEVEELLNSVNDLKNDLIQNQIEENRKAAEAKSQYELRISLESAVRNSSAVLETKAEIEPETNAK